MGICVSGNGLGGLVFSLSLNSVIKKTGNQRWSLRVVGLVALVTALIPAVIMKPRIKSKLLFEQTMTKDFIKQSFKLIFNLKLLSSYPILLISFWYALASLGYIIMLFSMASYARSVGLTPREGSILTSVINAARIVARPIIADSIA
jgi:hypothetical protein